jgi:hypothetical protein
MIIEVAEGIYIQNIERLYSQEIGIVTDPAWTVDEFII